MSMKLVGKVQYGSKEEIITLQCRFMNILSLYLTLQDYIILHHNIFLDLDEKSCLWD